MSRVDEKLVIKLTELVKEKYGIEPEEGFVMVEVPKDSSNGNYATNLAMRLTKILRRRPQEIGQEICEEIVKMVPEIEKATVAGPGFINFVIKNEALADIITTIIEADDKYGINDSGKGQRILMEYVSANPTRALHCGHARGAVWGDTCARLYKASGYDILREYYINDAGNQINMLALSLRARYRQLFGVEEELPEDGYHGQDVKNIAQDIKNEYGDK
ncbi:MAG: arginine--tRNA ligase, partial [Erysipelotrichaceae bacterium]|nr:arginine--tRNA ligase [Erysipelotrichaceae bacterium]